MLNSREKSAREELRTSALDDAMCEDLPILVKVNGQLPCNRVLLTFFYFVNEKSK